MYQIVYHDRCANKLFLSSGTKYRNGAQSSREQLYFLSHLCKRCGHYRWNTLKHGALEMSWPPTQSIFQVNMSVPLSRFNGMIDKNVPCLFMKSETWYLTDCDRTVLYCPPVPACPSNHP